MKIMLRSDQSTSYVTYPGEGKKDELKYREELRPQKSDKPSPFQISGQVAYTF